MYCLWKRKHWIQSRKNRAPCTLKKPQVIDYILRAIKTECQRKRSPETNTFIQRTNTGYRLSTLRPFRDQWWEKGGHSSDQETRCCDLIVFWYNRRSWNSSLETEKNRIKSTGSRNDHRKCSETRNDRCVLCSARWHIPVDAEDHFDFEHHLQPVPHQHHPLWPGPFHSPALDQLRLAPVVLAAVDVAGSSNNHGSAWQAEEIHVWVSELASLRRTYR